MANRAPQEEDDDPKIPEILPVLPVRDAVIFPYMMMPLFVGRSSSINSVDDAVAKDRFVFLVAQKDYHDEDPLPKGVYDIGTVSMIVRMHKLPDGRVKILVQGVERARIKDFSIKKGVNFVKIELIEEQAMDSLSIEDEAKVRTVRELLEKVIGLGKTISQDIMAVLDEVTDPGRIADLITSNLGLKIQQAQEVLEVLDPMERLEKVRDLLAKESQLLEMQAKIQNAAKEEMTKTQREYYLREQMRAIKNELEDIDGKGEDNDDLEKKISSAKLSKEALEEAQKQLKKLENMHSDSAEANIVRTYLEWLIGMPWKKGTRDNLDISFAKKVLNEDHFDLEKIKERILDYLAVCKLRKTIKGPVLCFVGPPGVGKTSLGRSIARAMNRKFVRMSLGGIKDEAEIRGHRRTYIGAMPGRIIQGIAQAGSNNPVFMLDELDKIGQDFRGDPASALLEVLDPEQNNSFRDHYINLPFDLSKVMFIATANITDPIPSALHDRMEIIELPGYSEEEKVAIAKKYLIPKQIKENGVDGKGIAFNDKAIIEVIRSYTKEAGLRNLDRELATVLRKIARRIAEQKPLQKRVTVPMLKTFLGPATFQADSGLERDEIGIATGLAWTQYGGEILHVEAQFMEGSGNKLTLTGHLGEVMKESAMAALTYVKSRLADHCLPKDIFERHELHIHVPAGAIPKDGPSAGVTMATALLSALSGRPIRRNLAMTGEITLQGRVLPVGGIKEKVLAAMRSNIFHVVLPEKNRNDLEEIPQHLRKKLTLVYVKHIEDVFAAALVEPAMLKPPAKGSKKSQPAASC